MPIYLTVADAVPRTGPALVHTNPATQPLAPAYDPATRDCGVVVYWPDNGWLTVVPTGGTGPLPFASDREGLNRVLGHYQALQQPAGQDFRRPEFTRGHKFLAGSVKAGVRELRLTLVVNTNAEKFAPAVRQADSRVNVEVLFFAYPNEQPHPETVTLTVRQQGAAGPAVGYFGLDLGNSGSTVARLVPSGEIRADQVELVGQVDPPAGAVGEIGTPNPARPDVPSDLRLDLVRSYGPAGTPLPAVRPFPDPARPEDADLRAVMYAVGETVAKSSLQNGLLTPGLVLGAKRLAAAREDTRVTVQTLVRQIPPADSGRQPEEGFVPVSLSVRTPLHLLAARLLHHVREAYKGWPAALAVTYPTTYSRFEIQELRRAVQTGWLRMHGWRADGPVADARIDQVARPLWEASRATFAAPDGPDDPLIRLLLDEASAAAFFHLYRAFTDPRRMTGGLVGFRYLYEHGLNLLLIDCGGGTTDIALVRARVPDDDARVLEVDVRGRSGVREFGGDDITRAVARLLKVKLAHAAGKQAGQVWASQLAEPKQADGLTGVERYLAAADVDAERLLATRRQGDYWADANLGRALALWRLAEAVKRGLSKPADDKKAAVKGAVGLDPDARPGAELSWQPKRDPLADQVYAAGGATDAGKVKDFAATLAGLKVHRWEVDALIGPLVERCVANCNRLIHTKLGRLPAAEGDVHWVVASGNATHYPLLQERLRNGLRVAFLNDAGDPVKVGDGPAVQRFEFDPGNAKGATAKGAALALAVREAAGQLDVRFKGDLAERLPFSVGYWQPADNSVVPLYDENERYADLAKMTPKPVPATRGKDGRPATEVWLMRQFPGDERASNYLRFQFPAGVTGELTVRYDAEAVAEFVMADGSGDVPPDRVTDTTDRLLYVSPSMRGEL